MNNHIIMDAAILQGVLMRINANVEMLEECGDFDSVPGKLGSVLPMIHEDMIALRTTFRAVVGEAIDSHAAGVNPKAAEQLPMELWPRSQLVFEAHRLGCTEKDTRGKSVKELRSMILAKKEAGVTEASKVVAKPPARPGKPMVKPPMSAIRPGTPLTTARPGVPVRPGKPVLKR
jgi:hypothetical protein